MAEKTTKKSQSRSAAKSFRQSEQARVRHKSCRNKIFTMEKKLRAAVEANDSALAKDLLNKQFSVLDKAVKSGTFHKNKADRKKSRMALLVGKMNKAQA
ncbi:MAG: 30S ribosomal protein S20 [Lentisphaeria bacterium]|nr:30S ribosomal protein S20 [Lentisphaeria bacterium]